MKRAKNKISCAFVVIVIAVLSLLLLPHANVAQGQTAQAKETFAAFWTRFKVALAKDDREAIARMTKHCKCGQMPFDSDKEFLDEWYPNIRRNRALPVARETIRSQPAELFRNLSHGRRRDGLRADRRRVEIHQRQSRALKSDSTGHARLLRAIAS